MSDSTTEQSVAESDVCIVGAGPAGLTAGVFTARADLDTVVLSAGESILRRNAHLENFPGFPAGVNARQLLEMMEDQADRNGCERRDARVDSVSRDGESLTVRTTADTTIETESLICTSWADTGYLDGIDALEMHDRGNKTYIETEDNGSTPVDGLYAAGRITGSPHQAVVAAGDGARVGLTVIQDSDVPFYHDWVAPEGYFTDRGREIPPGCEEIDDKERRQREHKAQEVMQSYFSDSHPEEPTQHPSVVDN
ncbi:NAD(P)/FAD-dependent oxidoreductase [Halovenus salina]|uniref:FAD-binding protein n=2 Tax=Halovenus salina TaxID=1510225 RepID=A0ABD5VYV9_9EURY|nr:FAD-binding protein [Halovenus salina]